MRIVWSRRAIRHLTHVRDYIAQDSPESAAEVAKKILEAVELLAGHPNHGRLGRMPVLANWWLPVLRTSFSTASIATG